MESTPGCSEMKLRDDDKTALGLIIDEEWADLIFSGQKTVETREYELVVSFMHRPVYLLKEHHEKTQGDRKPFRILGIVEFSMCKEFFSFEDFKSASDKTCVQPNHPRFGWKTGMRKYGWVIKATRRINDSRQYARIRKRIKRSLVYLEFVAKV